MMIRSNDVGLLAALCLAFALPACDGGGGGGSTGGGSTSGGTESSTSGESSGGSSSVGSTSEGSTSEGSTSEGTSSGGDSSGGSSSGEGSSSSGGASSSSGGETTGGEASLPEGFEDTLNEAGCADMTVFGRNPDDSIALVMHIDADLVANAALAGETYQATHDFDAFGTFSVLVGTQVSFPVCNDVATDDTVIEQEWVATAGSVEVTIVPIPDAPKFGTQGVATLQLSGVEVTYDGVTEALEDISFEDVNVGWLPG